MVVDDGAGRGACGRSLWSISVEARSVVRQRVLGHVASIGGLVIVNSRLGFYVYKTISNDRATGPSA